MEAFLGSFPLAAIEAAVGDSAKLERLGAAIEGASAALSEANDAQSGAAPPAPPAALAVARGAQDAVLLLLAVGAECGLELGAAPPVAGFDARALLQGGARACARALEARE
jgi:hypothetical protein